MKSIATQTPYGETIFCDDIREEVNGKISIIGIYSGTLIVYQPFPLHLAKFSLLTSYYERLGESSSPVELQVSIPGDKPGEPSVKVNLPIDEVRKASPNQKIRGEDILVTMKNKMIFTPLPLKEEGFIRVRAYRDDLEIRMGSIFVTYQAPATPPTKKPTQAKRKKKPAKKKATKKAPSK